jgi:hypothetical protein
VKLEGAYLAISQRDVEAEAEQASLRKIQKEQEWEDKVDQDILKELAEGEPKKGLFSWLKRGKSQEKESVQQQRQGLGATISQAERGDGDR